MTKTFRDYRPTERKCLLESGFVTDYDVCGSENTTYPSDQYVFLGFGKVYSVNGVLTNLDEEPRRAFFRRPRQYKGVVMGGMVGTKQ